VGSFKEAAARQREGPRQHAELVRAPDACPALGPLFIYVHRSAPAGGVASMQVDCRWVQDVGWSYLASPAWCARKAWIGLTIAPGSLLPPDTFDPGGFGTPQKRAPA